MASSAALVICLVVAGAAADVPTAADTEFDVPPPPAADGELPFLDYEDPPQLPTPTEGQLVLKSDNPDGLEPAQEGAEIREAERLEEASLKDNGLSEEQPEEAAGDVLEKPDEDVTELVEQPGTADVQGGAQREAIGHSEADDDHQHGTEFDQHETAVKTDQIPTVLTTEEIQDVRNLHYTEPAADEAAVAVSRVSAAAEDSSSDAFASSPVSFSVKEGGSLILPCGPSLASAGDLTAVSWHHSDQLLVDGGHPVTPSGRQQLLADGSLRLTSAEAQDDGVFTCRARSSGGSVTETSRHVHVLTRPAVGGVGNAAALQVVTEPAGGLSVVRRGQPATLACWAPGQPGAAVTWTKQEGALPYGESVLRGPRLEIGQVDPTHRGTYLCTVTTADNRTAVRSLQLQVNFSPEVTALEAVVHSGEDHQAALRCRVFSHPPAEVHWRRPSGRPLRPGHHLTTQEGDTFSLTLLVQTDDLDTYICTASNVFGSGEATVRLTGRPGCPVVTSPAHGPEPWSYTLTWRTPSVLPLLAYKLLYRQHAEDRSRPSGVRRSAWREAVLPLAEAGGASAADSEHRHEYVIRDLEPGSEYEVHVLAENRHGWSELAGNFRFRTAAPTSGEESIVLRQNRHGVADTTGGNAASSVRAGAATLLFGAAAALTIRL